jgi:prevent-host-death family protein
MNAIAAARFKATCLAVLDQVERTGEPVLVTKRGRPVAQVVPVMPEGKRYPQDSLRGSVIFLGDIVSPPLPPEAWDAVRGEGADPHVGTRGSGSPDAALRPKPRERPRARRGRG